MNRPSKPVPSRTGQPVLLSAALVGLLLAHAPALAASEARDSNPIVCADLKRSIVQKSGSENARQRNFDLFEAAKKGCGTVAAELLQAGASLEARDRFANTPLIHAAAHGQADLVDYFLDQGAVLDARNLSGSTALLRAVVANERKTTQRLLERGASVAVENRSGVTPLAAAAFNGNQRIVRTLLDAGAEAASPDGTGKPPIIYAAAKGFSKIVALFLEAGVPSNIRDGNDLTPLMWAAGHPNDVPDADALETIQMLLENGAELDLKDNRGRTALMIGAERGHTAIVSALIAAGADRSLTDKEGLSASDLASRPEISALLDGR